MDTITDDGEWIPVGTSSKKASKTPNSAAGQRSTDKMSPEKGSTSNKQPPAAEIPKETALTSDGTNANVYQNIVHEVTQRLLNRAFGEFYVFNDSKVAPICLSTIAESFESTNSGYIVVYRRKSLQKLFDSSLGNEFQNTVSVRPDPLCPAPIVSPLWSEITGEENRALAQVRSACGMSAEPDASNNQVLVQVFVPSQLMIDPLGGSLLIPRAYAGSSSSIFECKDPIYVLANVDTPIIDIKQAVWDEIHHKAVEFELLVSLDTVENLKASGQNKNDKATSPTKSLPTDKKAGSQSQSAWSVPLASRPAVAPSQVTVGRKAEPSAYFVPPSAENLSLNVLKLRGDATSNYLGWIPISSSDLLAKIAPVKSPTRNSATGAVPSIDSLTIGDILKNSPPQSIANKPGISKGSCTVIDITSESIKEGKQKGIINASTSVNLNMFIWNGSNIQNEQLRVGLAHEPRLFVVKFLVPGLLFDKSFKTPSADTTKQPARLVRPFVESQVEMWISGTTPVSLICQRAVRAVLRDSGFQPDVMSTHSVYVVETYGVANKNHAKEHAKGIYSKILWDASINGVVQAIKKDAAAKDLSGSELLVELFRPGLGSSKKNSETSADSALSLIESTFRNKEIDILFDVQSSLQRTIRQMINEIISSTQEGDSIDQKSNSSVLQLQKEPSCDLNVDILPPNITVDHTSLVFEMKWRLLKILIRHELLTTFSSVWQTNNKMATGNASDINTVGSEGNGANRSIQSLSSSLEGISISAPNRHNHDAYISYCISELIDRVRLVSGVSESVEATADDESKTVAEHGLKDGAMVTLELGAVVTTANSFILRCVPLFGNDPAEKLNPQKPGTRVGSLEVEFSFNKNDIDHIETVRLMFMELINKKISDMLSSLEKESTTDSSSVGSKLGCIVPFDPQNCRLRVTNWAEESDEAPLPEVSKEKLPTALNSFITSGKIKNRSLLILEVGKASIPGLCELEVR